ncbi:scarecrow-like protein 28 [Dorcoceras hygrometricum]|uniref:Scarecrow-like protein 28 n=1 Tax=Dorcoceras hygrometricum TaxID=472368 RepID=A0A2Z7D9U7_9LAMI|nr:scarecrow-like protein 28 [Dorcoceras hygrometricum]
MLAGCSPTLLSPRHRLRSEASTQFQVCHFPTMSTQRLDLPCTFVRKEASRSQPIRPVGLSIEAPIEAKTTGCSLRQGIKLPPAATTESRREKKVEFWEKGKVLKTKKRYAEELSYDEESFISPMKRKRGNGKSDVMPEEQGNLSSLSQLGGESFWFQPGFNVPQSIPSSAGLDTPLVSFPISCSREEERVCFVPSDISVPPLPPLSNIPWFDSVVITDLGDKNVEARCGPEKEMSGSSSTSSDSHGLVLRLSGNPEREIGNGSSPPNPRESAEAIVSGNNGHQERECVELVSLLIACVEQIGSRNVAAINRCLARLGELASPIGGSPVHRLAAYFTEGLALRVARLWPQTFHIATFLREFDRVDDNSGGNALRLLNHVSPIPKFIHFTSNEILLRTFEGKDKVHIIDFDIKQGLQWPGLFQSLASRADPPSHIRITGIGESKQELIETGDRLAGFAAALDLPFEFHPVVDRLEDVRLWMLHVKERESVAVNCLFQFHKVLYDNTGGTLRDFLDLIRSTKAEAIIMAEQEGAHNELNLDSRLSNSLKYYSAIFDSIDSSLPLDSPMRIKIEEMFGSEIKNIVACEGRDRFERHETFGKWHQLMEHGGFQCMEMSEREILQSQMLLKMYSNKNYKVGKNGRDGAATCLTLSWLDQPLYSVSAWKAAADLVGSSTSFPQPS